MITGPYDATLNALVDPACVGDEYYFYANETSTVFPATSYAWTLFPPTGFPTMHSGVQPDVTFDEFGTHTMQVTKNTNCGSITSFIEFDVQECYFAFGAYPNPSYGTLIIDPNGSDSSGNNAYNKRAKTNIKKTAQNRIIQKINLYDINGRLMKAIAVGKPGLFTIDVSDMTSGMYIVEVYGNNGRVQRKKIIIQR